MNNFLKHVPGFRTNIKWKKVVATVYYAFCVILLASGIGAFLIYISIPFIVFAVISLIKNRNKTVIGTLVAGIIVFSIGTMINPDIKNTDTSSKKIVKTKEVVATTVKEKTPEEIKMEAEAKVKADADAKIAAAQKVKDDAAAKIIADKKAIEDKKIADAKAIEDAKLAKQVAYKSWVDAQFSMWDGSHTGLVDLIKKNLNDKKSFEHEETTYKDMGTYLIVKMTYRAKNGFGGVILQNVTAKSDYKTNTITVTSQND
jgi:hypothetical protein